MSATVASLSALALVGHGSSKPAAQAVVSELVTDVGRLLPGVPVTAAYLGDRRPPVAEVLGELARGGVTRAAVVPLLLTAAHHAKVDVAGAVRAASRDLPRLALSCGRALGPHPLLLDAVDDRLAAAGVAGEEPATGVVLAAAGASDRGYVADIARTARMLAARHRWSGVEAAFASATRPTVPEAVRRLRSRGAARVVVVPYLLVPGHLADRVVAQSRSSGAAVVTGVLGAHPAVARLAVERYREAIAGMRAGGVGEVGGAGETPVVREGVAV
jgi:sirohydrochlorin ferrochelatase